MAITLDGTTGIASVDGSASSPSVRGSDSNSGIVYAADAIKFSTGGTERVAISNASYPRILQVVTVIKSSEFTESVAAGGKSGLVTGLTVSITPSSSSNKILVMTNVAGHNGLESGCSYIILRDSTEIFLGNDDDTNRASVAGIGLVSSGIPTTLSYTGLDSPSTTSSITYGIKLNNVSSAQTRTLRVNGGSGNTVSASSSITLMEVAG